MMIKISPYSVSKSLQCWMTGENTVVTNFPPQIQFNFEFVFQTREKFAVCVEEQNNNNDYNKEGGINRDITLAKLFLNGRVTWVT